MRRICVVTGTRAEYGLLCRLIRMIDESDMTQLQLVVTNMHLSPTYGETFKEIEKDGFKIDVKIPIIEEGKNDEIATLKSMARAISGFAEAFFELKPDLVVVLGDRYEILAAAEAALIERIPIAHIHGGEITEGAYDDSIRHAITKMSQLHFASTEDYRRRIIQLGEQPDHGFYVGSLGVENIKEIPLFSPEEVNSFIGFDVDKNTILVTYHPVTLSLDSNEKDVNDFIAALEDYDQIKVVFTMPNSDNGSSFISDAINKFVINNSNRSVSFKSLGLRRYLSVMKLCGAIVGNSSSGIIEGPSFHIPTLNIGDRQKGRISADSVYNCATDKDAIIEGLSIVLSSTFRKKVEKTQNPYDKKGTARSIFDVISSFPLEKLRQKHFNDII